MKEAEVRSMGMFIGEAQAAAIKEAMSKGSKVEMEESSFSDPGGDYCAVLVDGRRVATIDGY